MSISIDEGSSSDPEWRQVKMSMAGDNERVGEYIYLWFVSECRKNDVLAQGQAAVTHGV